MPLDRAALARVVSAVAESAANVEWRLVGTASSVLRGVELRAADVDVLFRDREAVDTTFTRLERRAESAHRPEWLPDAHQHFARLVIEGVQVELSTVEIATDLDTFECVGPGPWVHWDPVTLEGSRIPAVASELRLVTEVVRGRIEHISRLVDYLREADATCDTVLVERALVNADVPAPQRAQLLEALSNR